MEPKGGRPEQRVHLMAIAVGQLSILLARHEGAQLLHDYARATPIDHRIRIVDFGAYEIVRGRDGRRVIRLRTTRA